MSREAHAWGAGNQAEPVFFSFLCKASSVHFWTGSICLSRFSSVFGPVRSGSVIFGPVLKLIQPIFSVPGIFHYFSRIFSHFSKIIQNLQNKIKSVKNLKNTIIMSIRLE